MNEKVKNMLIARINEIRLVRKRVEELSRADFISVDELCDRFSNFTPPPKSEDFNEALALIKSSLEQSSDAVLLQYAHLVFSYASGFGIEKPLKDLIHRLQRAGKKPLAESLLQNMVENFDAIQPLRLLAEVYEDEKKKHLHVELLEKICALDETDFESCLTIAHETSGEDDERCLRYFQMALNRLLVCGNYSRSVEVLRLMANTFPSDVSRHLANLNKVMPHLTANEKFDIFAFLLKRQEKNEGTAMLSIVEIIKGALENEVVLVTQLFLLIKAYREIYKGHDSLEDYLLYSGLLREVKSKKGDKSARAVLSKLELFEKYISLVPGIFVRHNTFGEGVVRGVQAALKTGAISSEPKLKIDFKKKPRHQMTFRIAVSSLYVLKNDNIMALSAFQPQVVKDLVADSSPQGIEKLLTAVCNTLERPFQKKDIASLFVPSFLSKDGVQQQFNVLKVAAESSNDFLVRDGAIWFSEGEEDNYTTTLRRIKQTTKVQPLLKLLEYFFLTFKKETLVKKKPCIDIVEKHISEDSEDALLFLAFHHSLGLLGLHSYNFAYSRFFEKFFSPEKISKSLTDAGYAHAYGWVIALLKNELEEADFVDQSTKILLDTPAEMVHAAVDALVKFSNNLEPFYQTVTYRYEDFPGTFLYIVKHALDHNDEWMPQADALAKCIRLLVQFHRGIADFASGANKRLYNLAVKLLFDEERVFNFLENSDNMEENDKIFIELERCSFLENYQKIKIRQLHESIKK